MSFTRRGIRYGEEGTFGTTVSCTINFNNVLSWEARVNENYLEKELVTGERDAVSRVQADREVTARIESELINPRILYYALGSISAYTTTPYTIFMSQSTLPSMTVQRIYGPSTNTFIGMGGKIDNFVLNLEVGQDATYESNWIFQDATLITATAATVPSMLTVDPFMYFHGGMKIAGSVVTDLQNVVLEFNNNLTKRFSIDKTQGKPRGAYKLAEGRAAIEGHFTSGDTIINDVIGYLNAASSTSIEVELVKNAQGTTFPCTITIIMPYAKFLEYPDAVSGKDVYQVEFPFVALPVSGGDAVRIVCSGTFTQWSYNSLNTIT